MVILRTYLRVCDISWTSQEIENRLVHLRDGAGRLNGNIGGKCTGGDGGQESRVEDTQIRDARVIAHRIRLKTTTALTGSRNFAGIYITIFTASTGFGTNP
jgi:hypothetical protein